jgi:hypothetical protein
MTKMRRDSTSYIPRLNTTRSGSTGIASSHSRSNRGERAGEDGTRCRGERTSNGLAEHYELNVKTRVCDNVWFDDEGR